MLRLILDVLLTRCLSLAGRSYPGYNDEPWTNRHTDFSKAICGPKGQSPSQAPGFPRIKARPGDRIKVEHLENGHVWQVLDKLNAPDAESGLIYYYGTTDQSTSTMSLGDIRKWNTAGSGGNKKGKLLGDPQNYDDGICIEQTRLVDPKTNARRPGRVEGQKCATYITVPKDIPRNVDMYTMYWVWDYSKAFGRLTEAGKNHVEVRRTAIP